MQRISAYFRDVRREFSQVTWPTRDQAIRLTIVVVILALVMAIFLGAVDYGLLQSLRKFILPSF